MSAAGTALRETAPEPTPTPRRLTAVPIDLRSPAQASPADLSPKLRRGIGGFMALAVGILASGLFALLLLNTTLGEGSFRIRAMQLAVSQLSDQQQELAQKVALAESPLALQQRALALGMVPSSTPVFLRLSDGKILGVPVPAGNTPMRPASMLASTIVAKPVVKPTTKPVATPTPKPTTKPTTKPVATPTPKPTTKPTTKPKH